MNKKDKLFKDCSKGVKQAILYLEKSHKEEKPKLLKSIKKIEQQLKNSITKNN